VGGLGTLECEGGTHHEERVRLPGFGGHGPVLFSSSFSCPHIGGANCSVTGSEASGGGSAARRWFAHDRGHLSALPSVRTGRSRCVAVFKAVAPRNDLTESPVRPDLAPAHT